MFETDKDETISTVIRAAFILISMGGEEVGKLQAFSLQSQQRRGSIKRKTTDKNGVDDDLPRKKSGSGSFSYQDVSESVGC